MDVKKSKDLAVSDSISLMGVKQRNKINILFPKGKYQQKILEADQHENIGE